MAEVAGDNRQPVLERRGRDLEVGTAISERRAELAPTTYAAQVKREHTVGVQGEDTVEPGGQRLGELGSLRALQSYPALDLADRDDAEEQVGAPLRGYPGCGLRIPPASAQI